MSVNQFYEKYWQAPENDPDSGQLVRKRKAALKAKLAALPRGAKVADLGCGIGVFTNYLSGLGFDAVGIDISETSIAHAKRLYPDLRFGVSSLENGLPFVDGEFEAVWLSEVLEHLFDVHASLSEIQRILRPGGLLIVTCPYHALLKNIMIALTAFDRHYSPNEGPHPFLLSPHPAAVYGSCRFFCGKYVRPGPILAVVYVPSCCRKQNGLTQHVIRLPDHMFATIRRRVARFLIPVADGAARIPVLDGVRGVAILLVMLYHQTLLQGNLALDKLVASVGTAGWSGVDLFFVLSGFLITGILLETKGRVNYFRNFYARRVTSHLSPLLCSRVFLFADSASIHVL